MTTPAPNLPLVPSQRTRTDWAASNPDSLTRAMFAHFRAIAVKRYHTIRTIENETIAAHTGTMLGLAYIVYGDPAPALLKAIAFHDHAEFRTGDTPSDEKKRSPELKTLLDATELRVCHEWHIPQLTEEEETPEVKRRLKMLDVLSGLAFCYSEFSMGNRHISDVMIRYYAYWTGLNPTDEERRSHTRLILCLDPTVASEILRTVEGPKT